MSIPEWADRSVPLARRVELSHYDWDMTDETERHRAELVADVRVADELARADMASDESFDVWSVTEFNTEEQFAEARDRRMAGVFAHKAALAAYRERMGVHP